MLCSWAHAVQLSSRNRVSALTFLLLSYAATIFFFLEEDKQKENPPTASHDRKKSLDGHAYSYNNLIPICLSNFLSHLFLTLVLSPAKSACSSWVPEIAACFAFALVSTAWNNSSSPRFFSMQAYLTPKMEVTFFSSFLTSRVYSLCLY